MQFLGCFCVSKMFFSSFGSICLGLIVLVGKRVSKIALYDFSFLNLPMLDIFCIKFTGAELDNTETVYVPELVRFTLCQDGFTAANKAHGWKKMIEAWLDDVPPATGLAKPCDEFVATLLRAVETHIQSKR
jgi:hypothetical protein